MCKTLATNMPRNSNIEIRIAGSTWCLQKEQLCRINGFEFRILMTSHENIYNPFIRLKKVKENKPKLTFVSTCDLWLDKCERQHSGENVQNLKSMFNPSGQVIQAYGSGPFPCVASFSSHPSLALLVVRMVKMFRHGEPTALVERRCSLKRSASLWPVSPMYITWQRWHKMA